MGIHICSFIHCHVFQHVFSDSGRLLKYCGSVPHSFAARATATTARTSRAGALPSWVTCKDRSTPSCKPRATKKTIVSSPMSLYAEPLIIFPVLNISCAHNCSVSSKVELYIAVVLNFSPSADPFSLLQRVLGTPIHLRFMNL